MFKDFLDNTRKPYFICIGTPRNIIDSVAPRIGDRMYGLNIKYLGDMKNPVHGKNLDKHYKDIISKIDTTKYQVIGVDAMLSDKTDKIILLNKPCKPGFGVGKKLQEIGEITIGLNVLHKYPEYIDRAYDIFFSDIIENQEDYIEDLVDTFMQELIFYYDSRDLDVV